MLNRIKAVVKGDGDTVADSATAAVSVPGAVPTPTPTPTADDDDDDDIDGRETKEESPTAEGSPIAPHRSVKQRAKDRARDLSDKARDLTGKAKVHMESKLENTKDSMRAKVLELVYDKLDPAMARAASVIKGVVKDDDMPAVLKRAVDGIVDDLVQNELKEEVFNAIADRVKKRVHDERMYAQPPACSEGCGFVWLRANILYTLQPFDRGMWTQLRSVRFWMWTLLLLFPVWGIQQAAWLVVFLLMDKTDEFQLVNFVLGFKSSQFISVGIVGVYIGAVQLMVCTAELHGTNCADDGPGTLPGFYVDMVWYATQVVLTWVAIAFVPFSKKKGGRLYKPLKSDSKTMFARKGGRLLYWMAYDVVVSVLLIVVAVVVLTTGRTRLSSDEFDNNEHLLQLYLYWLKSLYGIFQFPFFILKIPIMTMLVLHVKPTGYNRRGEICPMSRSKQQGSSGAVRVQPKDSPQAGPEAV